MGIDFHAEENQGAYIGRAADETWLQAMRSLVNPKGKKVMDIGCGGGIYCKAWVELGAESVIGADFSEVMLKAAWENCRGDERIKFIRRAAHATGLPAGSADIVFARALIHHLPELDPFFEEAFRLLSPGGILIVQDRTMKDVLMPASPSHFRGYFLEKFPQLLAKESRRRPEDESVRETMRKNGFVQVDTRALWEVRRTYEAWSELETDLLARTGRSILHELSDEELQQLVEHIGEKVSHQQNIEEQDHWTIWIGVKG
ncbi:class I SAM-dependent methyltransferase [Brevibacillus choshinensis]|uniref:Methyltransferase domain-containing protein n=1 Tax=Brevibacillus choshinensis TaxID=54911 RepID=A0ABX7FVN3_BRECH|nr:class I SAM-dependent methyltransferase [Brevibacillus choshinensis]QRG69815.1 methyltransferase domain-containing protein [Brevibacillus choshinensis]